MKIVLHEKISASKLLEGFPGFGLIGTITTEYLIERLNCRQVGKFVYDELPATIAIHKGEIVHPMGIYYSEEHDLIILHAILDVKGLEWRIVDAVEDLMAQTGVKELISVEGVAGTDGDGVFCFDNADFESQGAKPIQESVIMGVTAALMVRNLNVSCLFVETQSQIPDSRAAAKAIEFLEKYFGFEVDVRPLLEQAEIFEEKFKNIMSQTSKTVNEAQKKNLSYLG